MRKIDIENWDRKDIFNHFSFGSNPFYMVTFKIDVTNLYNYVKKENLSFYYSMIYFCTQAINQVENFLYTIQDGEVYVLERRKPSFTDIPNDSELFHICTPDYCEPLKEFNEMASQMNQEQDFFLDYSKECNDLIYISSLPWIDMSAITNEMDVQNPKLKDDSVPRIAWGKYVEENGKKKLGISLEVNHRFIDGIHIGKFANILQESIDAL